jgi:hypothetical protein
MLIPPDLDEPVFSDKRWMVRVVTGEPMYFYVDGPFDGVDDGLIESFFNWDLYSDSVIYLFGDYAGLPTKLHNKTVIKQSSHKNDTSIACFYGTMIDITPKLIMDCKLVASFQGSLKTHPIRQKVYEAIQPFGSFHYETTPFWASTPPEEKLELRRRYLENLNDSQFILCPRGVGLNSIRFFEALRMGRIPVLIADDTKLPLEWLVNYDNFVVRVPEADILEARKYVAKWLESHDLASASQQALHFSLNCLSDLEKFTQLVVNRGKKVPVL